MITYPYITPATIVLQQAAPEATISTLCLKDPRLKEEIPAQTKVHGNIIDISRWINSVVKISVGSTESEMYSTDDFFVFGNVRAGDLMEAYGTLYRMRWVKYQQGKPNYELTNEKDSVDKIYAPQTEFQKQRFDSTKAFIDLFDQMESSEKAKVLSGTALDYSNLPQAMKDCFKDAVGALIQDYPPDQQGHRIDINSLSNAQITIEDHSKPGTGIREMWLKAGTNIGSYSFRWNDYDKSKAYNLSGRPIDFFQEPTPNDTYSAKDMAAKSKKTATLITIKQSDWTLASLLKYISLNFGVNFITNVMVDKSRHPFACTNVPLRSAMDMISKEYGDWQWEAAPGNFIVMRSPGSPRRR